MKYADGAAFRQALEARLRAQSLASGAPLIRLRKMVAFDRFLARLVARHPERWVLKGGLALQVRLGSRARTTNDVDLLLRENLPAHAMLVEAAGAISSFLDPALQRQAIGVWNPTAWKWE